MAPFPPLTGNRRKDVCKEGHATHPLVTTLALHRLVCLMSSKSVGSSRLASSHQSWVSGLARSGWFRRAEPWRALASPGEQRGRTSNVSQPPPAGRVSKSVRHRLPRFFSAWSRLSSMLLAREEETEEEGRKKKKDGKRRTRKGEKKGMKETASWSLPSCI